MKSQEKETEVFRKVHELKTWPVFYEKIIDGSKPFEVRNNDRNFQVNDILLLREYDPDAEDYTGRSCQRKVTYILGDNPFFQINNTVIMGIQPISQPEQDFPDIDFREQIANELTRDELIERCCDMKLHYDEMRKEWFEKTQQPVPVQEQKKSAKEILEKHGNWDKEGLAEWHYKCIIRAMEEYASQGMPDVSDEEIHKYSTDYAYVRGGDSWYDAIYTAFSKGAKWYRESITKKHQINK